MVKTFSNVLYSTKKASNETLFQEIEDEVKDSIEEYSHETIVGDTLTLGSGSVSEPSFHFTGDADCGIYKPIANTLGFSTGNKASLILAPTTTDFFTEEFEIFDNSSNTMMLVNNNGQILANDIYSLGASNPGFSFDTDTNTGMFRVSDNVIGFSTNGNSRLQISFATSNFSNDIEITSTEELRCNNISRTNTGLPLTITASQYTLNGDVSNNSQPHFLARKTLDQTIPTGATTAVDYDTDISNSTVVKVLPTLSQFEFNSIGKYLLTAEVWLEGSSAGTREAWFRIDASNYRYGYTRIEHVSNTDIKFTLSSIVDINNPSSYVELVVLQDSGGNMTFRGPSQFRSGEFSIVKLF